MITQLATTRPPHRCDCGCHKPLWRFIDGRWQCLNGALYAAIYEDRDDLERDRIYRLLNETRDQAVMR